MTKIRTVAIPALGISPLQHFAGAVLAAEAIEVANQEFYRRACFPFDPRITITPKESPDDPNSHDDH